MNENGTAVLIALFTSNGQLRFNTALRTNPAFDRVEAGFGCDPASAILHTDVAHTKA